MNGPTPQSHRLAREGETIKKIIALRPLLEESANFMLSGSKTLFKISAPEDLWSVKADPAQIGQVISNLLSNADEAMPAGGLIKITAENAVLEDGIALPLPPGRYVKLSIADQGYGILPSRLQQIFDPALTTKRRGDRLGLAVAYAIIKNHGGQIIVTSEPGRGTTWVIYLPAHGDNIDYQEPAVTLLPLSRGKVLIMDDERIVRQLLIKMLVRLGYEAEFAKHGWEAIQRFSEAKKIGRAFAVVILDLTIAGGMGGKQTLEKLLIIDPQVKAVASSGDPDDPVMADFRRYGFSGALAKPYQLSELRRVLNEVIRGSGHES